MVAVDQADLIVIGAGQCGVPLAMDAAHDGKRVVLFERRRLGGTCVNYGCTPSKTLLASAQAAFGARRGTDLGISATVHVDRAAVMKRVHAIRSRFEKNLENELKAAGVRLVAAEAEFVDERTVAGGGFTIKAATVVVDTGTSPDIPTISGLDQTPFLTNESFFDLESVPESLIVLGGGYVGLELAQGCARLGSRVEVIEPTRLFSREEPDAVKVVQQAMEDDGVIFHIGKSAVKFERDGESKIAYLSDGTVLKAGALLISTGRVPNSKVLRADRSGITLDPQGFIQTNAQLMTSCAGVYAGGEIARQPAFTHVSWEDYRRIKDVMNGRMRSRDDRPLAYSTFTDPQLARVGLTSADAVAAGYDVKIAEIQLRDVARGIEWSLERGFYRIVVDARSQKILGATLVGYEAGEIVHVIVAHMMNGAAWQVLDHSVHIHPTFCEGLPSAIRNFAPEH